MADPLLMTKLTIPPLRANLVARPRLLQRLYDGLWGTNGFARRFTLFSAGAGYGKTTLLSAWMHALASQPGLRPDAISPSIAWLSLDEGDNDPARFLAYVIAALQPVQTDLGASVKALLEATRLPPPQSLLTALINELAAIPAPFVLALDDCHTIRNETVHRLLAFLLDHQPIQMHVAVASREDPPLPLARWRARGQMVEIRQADLRFSPDECTSFLRQVMGLDLTADAIAALDRRTEGWVAGLQLAALSLHGRDAKAAVEFVQAFSGSNRYILDYLIDEVFRQQPPQVQEFLLRTAPLDQLSAPLCDAVLADTPAGTSPSREILDTLERTHLFVVPLDSSHTWYRYHHLFADLLRHQLQLHVPGAERQIHMRASFWYETHGASTEAIAHALAIPDWEHAARLIHPAASGLLRRGEIWTLLDWLGRLPVGIVAGQAPLCIDYAWPLMLAGQLDAAETWLARAEELAATGEVEPVDEARHILGQIAAARAYLARGQGNTRRAVEMAHQALALLPKSDQLLRGVVAIDLGMTYWHAGFIVEAEIALREAHRAAQGSGNEYARLAAQIFLARILAVRGELSPAAAALRREAQTGAKSPISMVAHLDLCALHYEWHELDVAAAILSQATTMAERAGHAEFLIAALLLQARLRMGQGDTSGALEAVRASFERAQTGDAPSQSLSRSVAMAVEVALAHGDLVEAQRWARQGGDDVDAHPFYRFLGLTQARLLAAMGQKQAASNALATCADRAARSGWEYGLIATRVRQSLVAKTEDAALAFLADALARAQAGRFIRTFADAGPAVAPLLHEAALRGIAPAYVGEILAALASDAHAERRDRPAAMDSSIAPAFVRVETLSPRELDVLRLMAAGLSNAAIAEKLIVGEGTVKTHVHHICGKLGAGNRTQAVARAQQLRLL